MRYLVMEVHPAYAVLLDEEGRFLKAANLHYQVGDTVDQIIILQPPRKASHMPWKRLLGPAALAACLCLAFFGYYRPNYIPYGTLHIQINPDVEMTVSQTERVLALEGRNEDGQALLAGYDYQGKRREEATDELVERAIAMGYLSDGDAISITVTSSDEDWRIREENQVQLQLEARYGETIVIQLGEASPDETSSSTPPSDGTEVVIPVPPAAPSSAPTTTLPSYSDTDYGDSTTPPPIVSVTPSDDVPEDRPISDGNSDYGVTDYAPSTALPSAISTHSDSDYEASNSTNYNHPEEDDDMQETDEGESSYGDD